MLNVNTRLNSKDSVTINWPKICPFEHLCVPWIMQKIIVQIQCICNTTTQFTKINYTALQKKDIAPFILQPLLNIAYITVISIHKTRIYTVRN